MSDTSLSVLAVVGSLQRDSVTRVVIRHVAQQLEATGCAVDVLDFDKVPLGLYNPDTAHGLPGYAELQARVHQADVIVLGSPFWFSRRCLPVHRPTPIAMHSVRRSD